MLSARKLLRMSMTLGALGLSTGGVAGGLFPTLPEMLDHEWKSQNILSSSRLDLQQFGLSAVDASERHRAVRQFLGSRGLHPLLNLVEKPSDVSSLDRNMFGLNDSARLHVREYALRAGRHEICKSSVRSVESPNGTFHVLGVTPSIDAVYHFADDAWISLEDAVVFATDGLRKNGVTLNQPKLTSFSRCLYPQQNELQPAWRIIIRSGVYPYVMYVGDTGVIEGDLMAFDATATVRAYSPNPTTGTLKDFEIIVNGDGYMSNEYFTTADAGDTGRLFSNGNSFLNAPGSAYFAEQSSFAHVNQHFDYSVSSGYAWKGPKPLTVKTHVVFSEGPNNAMYSPFDGSAGPFIMIGDGDGSVFQGLPYDSDVVSHEFGHHIIFGSVTKTSGESLVIHEGLADAIVFLRTGDYCLGESICPASSTQCQVKGQCLRTANNSMKYKDTSYSSAKGAHLQGQLVSGLMWDLRKSGKVPAADMSKLSIAVVSFLPVEANMQSLLTGLLDADFAMFNKQYQSAIIEAASNRGLSLETLGIDLASIDGVAPASSNSSKSSSSSGGKGFLGLCSIGTESASSVSAIWIGVILLLPLVVQGLLRRPVPVKVKKK